MASALPTNNPNFPEQLKKLELKVLTNIKLLKCMVYFMGDSSTVQAGNICATAWKDQKVVTIMYTEFDPQEQTTVKCKQKDGTRKSFSCLEAVSAYNSYMGGVDRGNQM